MTGPLAHADGLDEESREDSQGSEENSGSGESADLRELGQASNDEGKYSMKESGGQKASRTNSDGGMALPTSFLEMFKINASVMGFGKGASTWMVAVLDHLDNIVNHVTSAARIREEVCVLTLRLSSFEDEEIVLPQFKACLLAALRSTLPQVWSPKHEEAWTWLWENVVRLVSPNLHKPKSYETSLDATLGSLSSRRLYKVRRDIYAAFFDLAPIGQSYFKQSNTRLHFIAEKVLSLTVETFRDTTGMVSELSALGLKHVGFGIPTELFSPFVSACIAVMRRHRPDDVLANEAFQWSLILVAAILVRTIKEGSTVVMKAINLNSTVALGKALSTAPRGERATWLLHVQVGDQFISPLLWALEAGKTEVCHAIIDDLLTIRADRQQYYYGCDELFQRHPDIIERLTQRAPDMLRTLLTGLIWVSHRTIKKGQYRRVNYFVRNLLQDKKGRFSDALSFITSAGDPSIVSHPALFFASLLFPGRGTS